MHILACLSTLLPLAWAAKCRVPSGPAPLPEFKHLVTFGDSYTDVAHTSDGGLAWPSYAAGYANLILHPFAVGGATCSNRLTPKTELPRPLMESQIPAFQAEQPQPDPAETVYTLWIGTNDVGSDVGLLSGTESPGVTIVNVTSCAVDWVKIMYGLGARNFIFMNMVPLELAPKYSSTNRTFMTQVVSAGNTLSSVFLRALAPSLSGARIALFDTHSLFSDMYNRPDQYLNGTAPLNVDGSVEQCESGPGGGPAACPRDSFLWWNPLHPSEQADRIVAREIVSALGGNSSWATWIS